MTLDTTPIIAAIKNETDVDAALKAEMPLLFLLGSRLSTLPRTIARIKEAGSEVFVHLDLCEGLGKDREAVHFLAMHGATGVISTRSSVIRHAADCGIASVQRIFLLDSQSVETAFESIPHCPPTMLELMPGLSPKLISRFHARLSLPIIAGGLIETKEEIIAALSAGAVSVSTTRQSLWSL